MCKIHAVLVSAFLLAGSASATSIFFTDFDSGAPSQISGSSGVASTAAVNGNAGIDGLQVWQDYSTGNPNSPTTLTLTGLAANQSLNLDFNFLAIGSWDGTTEGAAAPDFFNVTLNSHSIFQGAFRNYGLASPEYPGCTVGTNCTSAIYPAPPAGTSVVLNQANSGDFGTSVYHIFIGGVTADATGNATFNFFASGSGWQGNSDESIGLDNIEVTTAAGAATPEPSTWALIAGALLCLPLIRRRAFGR